MADEITYRQAKNRDMAFVIELWRAMSAEMAAANPRYRVSEGGAFVWGRWAGEMLAGKRGCVILAEDNETPIGCILAFVPDEAPIYASRPRGRVSDVYVDPEYRRRGIAKELVKRAIEYLKSQGVVAIEVNAPIGVSGLDKLWEATGMKPFAVRYNLLLKE